MIPRQTYKCLLHQWTFDVSLSLLYFCLCFFFIFIYFGEVAHGLAMEASLERGHNQHSRIDEWAKNIILMGFSGMGHSF